ncbi:hypothetical protein JHK87_031720 [Glycine soja]|nr:hypothetical protein JHK87_031720 [Glycine soja]
MDLHWYLRTLEDVVIYVLSSSFSIQASRLEGLTGVWEFSRIIGLNGITNLESDTSASANNKNPGSCHALLVGDPLEKAALKGIESYKSDDKAIPKKGMARFDFSWGDQEYHQETLENLRVVIKSTKKLYAERAWQPNLLAPNYQLSQLYLTKPTKLSSLVSKGS